jgi:SAM-dependent methyltransferase
MFAPPLKAKLYAQWYELRKNASTMSANQNAWFADYATNQGKVYKDTHQKASFSVLSIGTGEGDNDLLWADRLSRQFSSVYYNAVEPNERHVVLLKEKVQNSELAKVYFNIHCIEFARFASPEKFDLIHFVHCIHWLEDPVFAVERARTMLNPYRRLLIIQQSEQGVPRLHQRFLPSLMGQIVGSLSAEQLSTQLTNSGIPHTLDLLDAHLDVTECIRRTEQGQALLGFMMGCDLRVLDVRQLQPLYEELEEMSIKGVDETYQLYEPVGIIEILGKGMRIK